MVVVVTGVAGVGKSSVGRALSGALGWSFIEGDEHHPAENVEKMRRGMPLTEADREPWLRALRERIRRCIAADEDAVLACSALKARHRKALVLHPDEVRLVFLTAPPEVIRERMVRRRGHFMPSGLLEAQLEALEPPGDVLALDARRPVRELVDGICTGLGLDRQDG